MIEGILFALLVVNCFYIKKCIYFYSNTNINRIILYLYEYFDMVTVSKTLSLNGIFQDLFNNI